MKRAEVPKTGWRDPSLLGILSMLDRCIQQADLQILQGDWDRTFLPLVG